MRTLFLLLSFIPSIIFAEDFILLCNGEEIKYIEGDPSTERGAKKIIGIQVYQKGMRVDGEWFDNKTDLTEDYSLKRSYIKTKDNINEKYFKYLLSINISLLEPFLILG